MIEVFRIFTLIFNVISILLPCNFFVDHLQTELSSEKCENAKLLSDISTLNESSKFLEEQINDLQVTYCQIELQNLAMLLLERI